MIKIILVFVFTTLYMGTESKADDVVKFKCKFDQNLIQQEDKNVGFLKKEKIDRSKICQLLACEDTLEVFESKSNFKNMFRLRNFWFNHQGILLDDYSVNKNIVSIRTFLSQAYFLESYLINKNTGQAKRTFYRFNDPDFYYKIKKIEESSTNKLQFYNEQGKISLKSLNLHSLEPAEVFYFEGECYQGVGV